MEFQTAAAAAAAFRKRFKSEPAGIAFAPGRVNIIGEHTDYNDGFVLPCAIDLATAIAFAPRPDGRVRIYSDMVTQEAQFAFTEAAREGLPFWARYVWGVGMSLAERGIKADGFDGYAVATVPQGGGLSSSASFEVAVALACLGRRAKKVKKLDLVHIARRAENKYVGTNCGVMDQFACIFGKEAHAILLDCRSLKSRLIPFPQSAALVVSDTTVRHVLGESGYHRRQEECIAAAVVMAKAAKGAKNLRDVSCKQLEARASLLGDVLYRRARHVVTENQRVKEAARAMAAGDLACLGTLMTASHDSLRHDFEVSCSQLDIMVESAAGLPGHFGTRMVGGGFGGCTVSLVRKNAAKRFAEDLARRYRKATGLLPSTRIVRPGQGAALLAVPKG